MRQDKVDRLDQTSNRETSSRNNADNKPQEQYQRREDDIKQ